MIFSGMCVKCPHRLLDPLQFNCDLCKLFVLSAGRYFESWLQKLQWKFLTVCEGDLHLKFWSNGSKEHFMATKLFREWAKSLSVIIAKVINGLVQTACADNNFFCCLSLSHQRLWHWNGLNTWVIYARNTIIHGNTQMPLSKFSWGEWVAVHRLP